MNWLDEFGIAHDGSPPNDSVEVGGRWYPRPTTGNIATEAQRSAAHKNIATGSYKLS